MLNPNPINISAFRKYNSVYPSVWLLSVNISGTKGLFLLHKIIE